MRAAEHFPANYSISPDVELPASGGPVVNFKYGTLASATLGVDGPLIRIEPAVGLPWLACFSKGYKGADVVNAILATPNPNVVCVVCEGAGYWVDTVHRTKEDVRAFPVRQIEAVREFLIFVDFTKVAAYGSSGVAWVSQPLVSDRLVLEKTSPDSDVLVCQGLNAATGRHVEIRLDVRNGRVP